MPTTCSICSHPNVAAIDAAIRSGALSRDKIGKQFNVSPGAVQRHKDKGHVAESVVNLDEDAPEVVSTGANLDVPAELLAQYKRTLGAVRLARRKGNLNAMAQADREHRMTLEAISKWNLEAAKVAALSTPPSVVNLNDHAQWLLLRTAVFDVLGKPQYVSARLEVAEALEALLDLTPEEFQRQWELRKSSQYIWRNPPKEAHAKPPIDPVRTPGESARPAPTRAPERQPEAGPQDAGTGPKYDYVEAI